MRMRLVLVCLLLIPLCGQINAGRFDLVNYPFHSERDMIAYNYRCEKVLEDLKARNADPALARFLITASAFTSAKTSPGEEYSIVNFANGGDPALVRLRGEIGLPPPSGGAVIRLYQTRDDMPAPIHGMFADYVVNGITWGHRFIAILKADHSEEQIANAVSHELVHAYMSSLMGPGSYELPKWFIEGTALYIAGGKSLYISETDQGRNISSYTKEYNEYSTMFRYLRAKLGEQAVAEFIRDVVDKQSADEPLRSLGIKDGDQLKAQALHWDAMRQVRLSGILIAIVAAIGIMIWRAHRKAVALWELEHPEEVLEEEEDWQE